MKVIIDKFGRVLIPKSLRNHLGIKPGTQLEIAQHDHTILLKLVEFKSPLIRKGTALVYTGEATDDLENIIEKERDDRLRDLSE